MNGADPSAEGQGDEVGAFPPLFDWGVAARPLLGQTRSGDLHLVKPFPGGVLVAVVDGLGHGYEAADAAGIAVATLEAHADEEVTSLVMRCHERLRSTRGVALTLASVDVQDGTQDGVMRWLGVGNVEGLLWRADPGATPAREYVVLRGGVVGEQLPPLRASVIPIRSGDTLIFATDGISHGFAEGLDIAVPPQAVAERIMATHGKSTDDVLVLVARYLGRGP